MNYVISITGPEALGVLEDICEELALPLNVTLHGRGTAVQSMLDLLGIESNEKRVVLSTATEEKTAALIEAQKRRLHIGVPGHGIVIAVPVKSIGGGKTVAYLMGEENKSAKTAPPSGYAYELIVVVASEGQTDLVMNAARAAGARGGTIMYARGAGLNETESFFGISIHPEKEMILIVADNELRLGIMQAIARKVGLNSEGAGITFSLPVTDIAGIAHFNKPFESEKE